MVSTGMGKTIDSDIVLFQEKLMQEMNLPEWIKKIQCPFCHKDLSLRSIRNIQLCLNARNFGEIAIEVMCNVCDRLETIYFRTKIRNMDRFVEYLNGHCSFEGKSFLERDMYDEKYNCVVEEMLKQRGVNTDVNDQKGNS